MLVTDTADAIEKMHASSRGLYIYIGRNIGIPAVKYNNIIHEYRTLVRYNYNINKYKNT